MKPGSKVASPRSMTCAPSGIFASLPTARILVPDTTTTPWSTSLPDTESNRCAAFSTMGRGGAAPGSAKLDDEKITAASTAMQLPANMRCLMKSILLFVMCMHNPMPQE